MEVIFEIKTGKVLSTQVNGYEDTIELEKRLSDSGEIIEVPVRAVKSPIIVQAEADQDDVQLTDGKNKYLIPRLAGMAIAEEGDLIIMQSGQLLRKYSFQDNTFTPSAASLTALVNKLNKDYFA